MSLGTVCGVALGPALLWLGLDAVIYGPSQHPRAAQDAALLVGAQSQDLLDCYETYGASELQSFELSARVWRGRIWSPQAGDSELERCAVRAARSWRVSPSVKTEMRWPLVLTAAPAALLGAPPEPVEPRALDFALGRREVLQESAQLLPEGVLLVAAQVEDGALQSAHALRDTSPEQVLTDALLPSLLSLGQSSAPPDMPGLAWSISSGPLPQGRAPSEAAVQACVGELPASLSVAVEQGRVVAAWGDPCLARLALAWQLDPALEGGLRWSLYPAMPVLFARPPTPELSPEWERETVLDPQALVQENLRYYRALAARCLGPSQSAVVQVELRHGLTQSVRLVQSSGDAQADACVVAQAQGWRWPATVQQTRRVSLP